MCLEINTIKISTTYPKLQRVDIGIQILLPKMNDIITKQAWIQII